MSIDFCVGTTLHACGAHPFPNDTLTGLMEVDDGLVTQLRTHQHTLRELCISKVNMEYAWDLVLKCTQLRKLQLNNCNLSSVPADIGDRLPHLQWLNLSYNRITELPERLFSDITSLDFLFVSSNMLTKLPATLTPQIPYMMLVDVSDNEITLTDISPELLANVARSRRCTFRYEAL